MASSVQIRCPVPVPLPVGLLRCGPPRPPPPLSSSSASMTLTTVRKWRNRSKEGGGGGGLVGLGGWRKKTRRAAAAAAAAAAVQEQSVQHGASAAYAKEMERLSAKESLLLAFEDSGGFQALVTGRTTDLHRIDVNERITALERLNPTPRPSTSPFLEGTWNFQWLGSPGNPPLFAAAFLFPRFPSALLNLSQLITLIKDGNAKSTANFKLFNYIDTKFILSSKLSVEGPFRMKEEYVEGVFEKPIISEESVPEQLRGSFGQIVNTVQQLPLPIQDTVASGLTVPLSGAFQRLFMISYLDEEILIIRDSAGAPEVLTRLDVVPALWAETSTEYES